MKVSILRRIETLEKRVGQEHEPPEMIMIYYDDSMDHGWKVTEHYPLHEEKKNDRRKTKTNVYERLKDYFFPADFNGRVILDTFASPDPAIYGNLFCFDMEELRAGQPGEIAIQSISDPGDGIIVQIDACIRN